MAELQEVKERDGKRMATREARPFCNPAILQSCNPAIRYFVYTVGVTDMPGRSMCSGSCPASSTILTGTRCTTFT